MQVNGCLLKGPVTSLYQLAANFNTAIYETLGHWEPQKALIPIRVGIRWEVREQLEPAPSPHGPH
jgi:hypothetical protein